MDSSEKRLKIERGSIEKSEMRTRWKDAGFSKSMTSVLTQKKAKN